MDGLRAEEAALRSQIAALRREVGYYNDDDHRSEDAKSGDGVDDQDKEGDGVLSSSSSSSSSWSLPPGEFVAARTEAMVAAAEESLGPVKAFGAWGEAKEVSG